MDALSSEPTALRPGVTSKRFAATTASILTLAALTAPGQPVSPGQPVDPSPTTLQASMEQNISAAASQPTTVQVVIAEARPRTQPTTEEVVVAARRGDIYTQIGTVLGDSGIAETVRRTAWWQWTGAAASVVLGVLLGRLFAALFHRLGLRSATRVRLMRAVVYNSLAGPLSLFVLTIGLGVAAFGILRPPAPVLAILIPIFQLLHIVTIGWLLFNLVDLVTLVMSRLARGRQGNLGVMLVPMTQRVLRVSLVLVLVLFAANNVLNWNIGALLTGLGIAGLAVSLAAQDTLRNLFGSVMIFADQPFALGDSVKITDFEGKVEDIGFRSTRLRTADGSIVTIPNGNIAGAAVLNYSRRRAMRRTLTLTLASDTPVEKVRQTLDLLRDTLNAPELADLIDPSLPSRVVLEDAATMKIGIIVWLKGRDEPSTHAGAETINLLMIDRLRQAGIGYR
jgi:MscS family membrane protein